MDNVIPVVIGTYYNAYSIVRGFGENGIKSILITHGENNFVQKSKYIEFVRVTRNVNLDEESFIEDLLTLGREIAPAKGMFFPTHDEHLLAIAKYKDKLQEYFEIPFSDYDILNSIMDKNSFMCECKRLGIPTIEEIIVHNYKDAEHALEKLGTPILVKVNQWDKEIINGLGDKINIFTDGKDYLNTMKLFFETVHKGVLLVQEYIKDTNVLMPTVNSFTDKDGKMQCIYVGEKLRQFPPQTGTSTSYYARDPQDPKYKGIIEYTKRIVKEYHFYGLFGIEYKYDPKEGVYKIIEMNCRSEFPNYLQTLVGQNMAFEIYKYHIGQRVTVPYYPIMTSAMTIVPLLDWFYVRKYNYYKFPKFTMTQKEWETSLIQPLTLYGLTKNDYFSYVYAYFLAWITALTLLFRCKFNVPANLRTRDYLKSKLHIFF